MTLTPVVLEVERHVAEGGWDQPPRLFALAQTAALVAREPALAAALGLTPDDTGWTPVEQEEFPADRPVDEVLAQLAWPDDVVGCALVLERIMLPPGAEDALPSGPDVPVGVLAEAAAAHPERQDVRLAVAVLRDGTRMAAIRVRTHDRDDSVLTGPDLVPALAHALAATLRD